LDISTLLKSIEKTGRVVTAEEHQKNGGLGDSVAQALALHKPCPMEMVGVNDSFGESGKPDQLMKKYGLDSSAIVDAVKSVLKR
jgi:transketolase